jgi:hypothetical protein
LRKNLPIELVIPKVTIVESTGFTITVVAAINGIPVESETTPLIEYWLEIESGKVNKKTKNTYIFILDRITTI